MVSPRKKHARNKKNITYVPKPAKAQVTIIIPLRNNLSVVRQCLSYLIQNTPSDLYTTILVDNNSSDQTSIYFNKNRLDGLYLKNTTNAGFGGACNQALQYVKTPYIVFLHSDSLPQKGWLEPLLNAIRSDKQIGIAGSLLVDARGLVNQAGGVILSDGTQLDFGKYLPSASFDRQTPNEIDYCSSAGMLIPTNLFRDMGGFDRQFSPIFYEDVDLCFAVRHHGYKVVLVPQSKIHHLEGSSISPESILGFNRVKMVNREKFSGKWCDALRFHEPACIQPHQLVSNDRLLCGNRHDPYAFY